MKPLTIFSSLVASILGIGTIPAGNAIWNDVRWLKGKTFEEAYKDGVWNVRFFKTDLTLEQFKDIKQEGKKYDGLDGNKECGASVGDATHHYWLFEITPQQFEKNITAMTKDSESTFLILVEFKKNGDWFGRSTTKAWFGFNRGDDNEDARIKSRMEKISKSLKSNGSTPSKEAFSLLEEDKSKANKYPAHSLYVHDRLLLNPLELDMEKSKNCRKLKLPTEHRITI